MGSSLTIENGRAEMPSSAVPKPNECQICGKGQSEVRLVCDHDHKTKMIRGILCEFCNSYLGNYEANIGRNRQRGSKEYLAWLVQFQEIVPQYRIRNTKIPGSKGSRRKYMRDCGVINSGLLIKP